MFCNTSFEENWVNFMAKIADYVVIRDNSFEINELDHMQDFTFFVNNDLVKRGNASRAILGFNIVSLGNSNGEIQISSNIPAIGNIGKFVIAGKHRHAFWETFSANNLKAGENNIIRFDRLKGKVRISDVILWYQRDIA